MSSVQAHDGPCQMDEEGYFVLENVLSAEALELTKSAMQQAQAGILKTVGKSRLEAAEELGVLRLMMQFDPYFFSFLGLPEVLAVIDKTLGPTAILHLQNGFILPSLYEIETQRFFKTAITGIFLDT